MADTAITHRHTHFHWKDLHLYKSCLLPVSWYHGHFHRQPHCPSEWRKSRPDHRRRMVLNSFPPSRLPDGGPNHRFLRHKQLLRFLLPFLPFPARHFLPAFSLLHPGTRKRQTALPGQKPLHYLPALRYGSQDFRSADSLYTSGHSHPTYPRLQLRSHQKICRSCSL